MRDIRLGMSVKMQEKAISSNNLSFVQKKNRVKLKEKLEKREKELNEWTNCILGLQKHIDLNE